MNPKLSRELKTGIRWLVLAAILASIGTGGWLIYGLLLRPTEPTVAVRLLPVQRGAIANTINETGVVMLRNQQTLKSPVEGAVDRVLVQPGDRVVAGQLLLTLRYPERETILTTQQLQIQSQELNLVRQRQRIKEIQEQLAGEQDQLQRWQVLTKEGAIPQQQLQDQQGQVRNTLASLRDARTAVETTLLDLQRLRLDRQRIQAQIQDTLIRSPIVGQVLDVQVINGDGVQFRTELLTVGDPTEELVQLQLSTLNAAQVRPQQQAKVSVIGPNAEVYQGRVRNLYPQAILPQLAGQPQPNPTDPLTVPAIVVLDRPTNKLIPGSQVNVEIILESRQDAIVLSAEAVQQLDSQPFVWIRNARGEAEKRPVTVGLEGLLEVEITSGLQLGEKVVLPPADQQLQPGMRLVPQTPSGSTPGQRPKQDRS